MRSAQIGILVLAAALPAAAQVCTPRNFSGAYGYQLSGNTTISGDSKPVAAIGRLEFNDQGGVAGVGSVNFAGYFLGNPVTGSYEVHTDCTISWSLQDTSGAFQHFSGTVGPDLQRATFRQTDPGGAGGGTLAKLASDCSNAASQGSFTFSISGGAIPMNPGEVAHKISFEGTVTADAAGNLSLLRDGVATPAGTAAVGADCIVDMTVTPSPGASIKLRGVLVSGGCLLYTSRCV